MQATRWRRRPAGAAALIVGWLCAVGGTMSGSGAAAMTLEEARKIAAEQTAQRAGPPRKIDDITQLLEQARPDPVKVRELQAIADAPAPSGPHGMELADFYYKRALAALDLGRAGQGLADIREAWRLAEPTAMLPPKLPSFTRPGRGMHGGPGPRAVPPHPIPLAARVPKVQQLADRILQRYTLIEGNVGDPRRAAQVYERARANFVLSVLVYAIPADGNMADQALRLGDVATARHWIGLMEEVNAKAQKVGRNAIYRNVWTMQIERRQGALLLAVGRLAEAEATLRRALHHAELTQRDINLPQWDSVKPPPGTFEGITDKIRVSLAETLAREGKLIDAEVEARRALIETAARQSEAATTMTEKVLVLADIVQEQGRYADAQRLAEAALDIMVKGGVARPHHAAALQRIAVAQASRGLWDAALATFDKEKQALAGNTQASKRFADSNPDLAVALLRNGQAAGAIPIFEAILKERAAQGQSDYTLSVVRGFLGIALGATGRTEEALRLLQQAVPVLLSQSDAPSREEGAVDEENRRALVIDGYVALLARVSGTEIEKRLGFDAADEAFRMADAAHAKSLQSAITASIARAASGEKGLASLIRQSQDVGQKLVATYSLLRSTVEGPADAQAQQAIESLRKEVAQLQGARATLRQEIARRFPQYGQLVDPKPATIAQAQAKLAPGEVLLATYFTGDGAGVVWAVPRQGAVVFARITPSQSDVVKLVGEMRTSVDSSATTTSEIPPFPVAAAHALYAALFDPVAAALKDAKSVVVVPDAVLGTLPFALLVTRDVSQPQEHEGQPLFAGYRDVPFLVRDMAVTQVPSVAAFVSLRSVAAGSAARKPFIGFGDPWFTPEQAQEARAQSAPALVEVAMRGVTLHRRAVPKVDGLAVADLAQLPRLPDTAEEVREVALALHADPATDVRLGAEASVQAVLSAKLDDRRVVMFATHGLVPGEIDGLTQPALALSSPAVPGVKGDGLLTVAKILGLKLDADWVVLSACNTAAAGESGGAEAVSGLGRAFFYAGTRALLVTNWPVETASARALTTDVFRRQAAAGSISRAEALRGAMLDMIDKGERVEPSSGRVDFTYAHPMFWAPFALVGDGGGS
jgi:CHAT domain-containing protein